jgi:hypothetical protein
LAKTILFFADLFEALMFEEYEFSGIKLDKSVTEMLFAGVTGFELNQAKAVEELSSGKLFTFLIFF